MSSVSLYEFKRCNYGNSASWDSYWYPLGQEVLDISWHSGDPLTAGAYSIRVNVSSQQKLTGCSVKVNIKNTGTASGTGTVYCYLYTSDPTTGSYVTSVPSGYIKSTSASVTLSANAGKYQTFSFTGLSITASTTLYCIITASWPVATWYFELYDWNNGTSGFGTPTATGTFADMSTTVGTPTASVVDLTGNFPSTYIAGYSKVKVAAAVSTGSGATISTVKLSYPGGTTVNMTYNSSTQKYEATTAAPITGNTTFTVTATNSSGYSASKTVSITGVVPYTTPSVTINESGTYRCNSGGTKESGGTHFRAQATANWYSSLSGNALLKFTVKIKPSGAETNLTSGVQSSAISGMSNANQSYTIVFTIQDKVSSAVTREYVLEGALRDFVLTRGTDNNGAHLGLGMTPEVTTGKSSIELPQGGRIRINSHDLFYTPGTYEVTMPCFGYVTSAGNRARLNFMPMLSLAAAASISVTAMIDCGIRTSSGGYLDSVDATLTADLESSSLNGGMIFVELYRSAGWGVTNNTVVAGIATVTFTVT